MADSSGKLKLRPSNPRVLRWWVEIGPSQKLVASGQLGNVSRRHACYWKNLAEELTEQLSDPSYSGTVSIELEYSPEPDKIVEWVEEAYRGTAEIMREIGVR